MADTKTALAGRIAQVSNWLRDEHPAPFPVRVSWREKIVESITGESPPQELLGLTVPWKKTIRIFLSRCELTLPHFAIDTLLHEWAHAVSTTYAHVDARRASMHDDAWALAFARIYRAYHEDGGADRAAQYLKKHLP